MLTSADVRSYVHTFTKLNFGELGRIIDR